MKVHSILVWDCLEVLQELGEGNRPGYKDTKDTQAMKRTTHLQGSKPQWPYLAQNPFAV